MLVNRAHVVAMVAAQLLEKPAASGSFVTSSQDARKRQMQTAVAEAKQLVVMAEEAMG